MGISSQPLTRRAIPRESLSNVTNSSDVGVLVSRNSAAKAGSISVNNLNVQKD